MNAPCSITVEHGAFTLYHVSMRRWKPQIASRRIFAWVLLAIMVGATLFVGIRFVLPLLRSPDEWPISIALYGQLVLLLALLMVTGQLTYRIAAGLTLAYEMDRNGLYIVWLGNRAVVPLEQIESIDVGATGATVPSQLFQGFAYYWGQGRTREGRTLHLFTTRPLGESLIIHTATASYALAPAEQEGFVQDLEQRRRLGAVKSLTPTVELGRTLFYAFWADQLVRRVLVTAGICNLLLLGLLSTRYPQLPPTIALRFDAAGQPADLVPRHQSLYLPLVAFSLILINIGLGLLFYQREPTGARMLQIGSVIIQLLFAIAVFHIIF